MMLVWSRCWSSLYATAEENVVQTSSELLNLKEMSTRRLVGLWKEVVLGSLGNDEANERWRRKFWSRYLPLESGANVESGCTGNDAFMFASYLEDLRTQCWRRDKNYDLEDEILYLVQRLWCNEYGFNKIDAVRVLCEIGHALTLYSSGFSVLMAACKWRFGS